VPEETNLLQELVGGGSAPPKSGTSPSDGDRPEENRVAIQLFLGQLHGLLDDLAVLPTTGLSTDDRDSLEAAYREASFRFGRLQAALNTGSQDAGLDDKGLSGRQLVHKWRRWRKALASFLQSRTGQTGVKALRAGQVLLGSLVAAVPVAEPVRELVDTFIETLSDIS
jgi:hypothetical protein